MPSYPTRKTKKGIVYDVRFRIIDETGLEVQKRLSGYPTKKAAQQAYVDFMKSYTPPSFVLNKDGSFEFDELLALYFRTAEANLASSSFYDLQWIFDKFITPHFSGKTLTDLKKIDFVNWQTALWTTKNPTTDEYYAQRYLSKIRTVFSGFLSWCEETYDIPNLLRNIKKPTRKEMKKEMQIWELEEFVKFQSVVDDVMWQAFFSCLFYSGCRVGELLALSDSDVMFDNGTYSLIINKNLSRKGHASDRKYTISPPKTAGSNRTVALPQAMNEILDTYLKYKAEKSIAGDFLFGGDTPLSETTYQRRFREYAETANIKKIRIHDLRHSHASMLIHLNVPITVVSKRLGHSSIDMTLKRYAHCYSDADAVALTAINDAICAINVPKSE